MFDRQSKTYHRRPAVFVAEFVAEGAAEQHDDGRYSLT